MVTEKHRRRAKELVIALHFDGYNLHAQGLSDNIDSDKLVELVLSIDDQLKDSEMSKYNMTREFINKWFR